MVDPVEQRHDDPGIGAHPRQRPVRGRRPWWRRAGRRPAESSSVTICRCGGEIAEQRARHGQAGLTQRRRPSARVRRARSRSRRAAGRRRGSRRRRPARARRAPTHDLLRSRPRAPVSDLLADRLHRLLHLVAVGLACGLDGAPGLLARLAPGAPALLAGLALGLSDLVGALVVGGPQLIPGHPCLPQRPDDLRRGPPRRRGSPRAPGSLARSDRGRLKDHSPVSSSRAARSTSATTAACSTSPRSPSSVWRTRDGHADVHQPDERPAGRDRLGIARVDVGGERQLLGRDPGDPVLELERGRPQRRRLLEHLDEPRQELGEFLGGGVELLHVDLQRAHDRGGQRLAAPVGRAMPRPPARPSRRRGRGPLPPWSGSSCRSSSPRPRPVRRPRRP